MRNMNANPVPAKFDATLLVLSCGRVCGRLPLPLEFSSSSGLSVRRSFKFPAVLSLAKDGYRLSDVAVELPSSVRPFFARVFAFKGQPFYIPVAASVA